MATVTHTITIEICDLCSGPMEKVVGHLESAYIDSEACPSLQPHGKNDVCSLCAESIKTTVSSLYNSRKAEGEKAIGAQAQQWSETMQHNGIPWDNRDPWD